MPWSFTVYLFVFVTDGGLCFGNAILEQHVGRASGPSAFSAVCGPRVCESQRGCWPQGKQRGVSMCSGDKWTADQAGPPVHSFRAAGTVQAAPTSVQSVGAPRWQSWTTAIRKGKPRVRSEGTFKAAITRPVHHAHLFLGRTPGELKH